MNNKERAAMQQALEALERWRDWDDCNNTAAFGLDDEDAITALREALEQPVSEFPDDGGMALSEIFARQEALAEQAEQEPVAYHVTAGRRVSDGMQVVFDSDEILYAAPVRTKDLTDEDLLEALKSVDSTTARLPQGFKLFARAVIQAFKEKNNV